MKVTCRFSTAQGVGTPNPHYSKVNCNLGRLLSMGIGDLIQQILNTFYTQNSLPLTKIFKISFVQGLYYLRIYTLKGHRVFLFTCLFACLFVLCIVESLVPEKKYLVLGI